MSIATNKISAPTISAIFPNRTISPLELPGLVITVVGMIIANNIVFYILKNTLGTNFGASNLQLPLAPVFEPSFAGRACSNISFEVPHERFTCQLGPFGTSNTFQLSVGDQGQEYLQTARFNLTFLPCNGTLCSIGCDRVAGSGLVNDSCGVCGGNNSTCPIGCDGIVGSGRRNDSCGVCGGNNSTCVVGCDGILGSRKSMDSCGVCGGDNACKATPGIYIIGCRYIFNTKIVNTKDDDDDNHGAIIGGVIGGFVGVSKLLFSLC